MSNSTSISEEASVSSVTGSHGYGSLNPLFPPMASYSQPPPKAKKKRNQTGNPDPDAEVVALSPRTLLATSRFVCEVCGKGFQRDQNLQLHRRGHNLPWKLRQRSSKEVARKKVYVCPEESCVHHHPSRALGDLTGIKKHFCRKHGEKKWKCERCSKRYAVMSDWKAHAKTCGTREYRCNCGTVFSRKDSFVTHRAFCDALAAESARLNAAAIATTPLRHHQQLPWESLESSNPNPLHAPLIHVKTEDTPYIFRHHLPSNSTTGPAAAAAAPHLSATALLQRAAAVGYLANATSSTSCTGTNGGDCLLTRDFLGVACEATDELLSLTAGRGLHMVETQGASSCDRAGAATAPIAAAKAVPSVGFGFHYHPSEATVLRPWHEGDR